MQACIHDEAGSLSILCCWSPPTGDKEPCQDEVRSSIGGVEVVLALVGGSRRLPKEPDDIHRARKFEQEREPEAFHE